MKTSDLIGGIGLTSIGIFAMIGIWFPRLRGVWKGTETKLGTLSSIGFGCGFTGLGLGILVLNDLPQQSRAWFVLPAILGFLLVFIGQAIDFRRADREQQRRPEPPIFLWVGVAVVVTITILLFSLRH